MESGRTAVGVLVGIGVGAVLGILFAPAKGSKTRQRIMSKGQNYADDIKNKFEELYEDVANKYDSFSEDNQSVITKK